MSKKNILTKGKKAKGDEAVRNGHLQDAHRLFSSICRADPSDVEAWVKLGLVEKRLGNFKAAETCALKATAINPKLGFGYYALGAAQHSQGRIEEAIVSYRRAISLQPEFADSYYLLGSALHDLGQPAEAVLYYQKAIELRPMFADALANLGAIYIDLGDPDMGVNYLSRAVALQPGEGVFLTNLGNAFRQQGKMDAALDTCRRALRLSPDSADVMANLANLLEKTGATSEATTIVTRGLEMTPNHAGLNLVAAELAKRDKRFQEAAALLEKIPRQTLPLNVSGDIELALGQIYDALDETDRAFPLIVSGKTSKAKTTNLNPTARLKFLDQIELVGRLATPALASSVATFSVNDAEQSQPAFLIGFPRSGTTLLEQILDAHPRIQAMEEKGCVKRMVNTLLADTENIPDALAALTPAAVDRLRKIYWEEAARHVTLAPNNILLDKLPLNITLVPIIWRIFPRAKFILAIRHPCDASLSCLMQNFAANEAMACFTNLEDTVTTYVAVMQAWQRYSDLLPLDCHRIRYEDLVADTSAESRRVLEFLGVEWNDAVLKHDEHAKQRGSIHTPSYQQVVQPIYQHAKYRWKRYEKQLAPVLPALQPYIDYFGYGQP